MKRRGITQKSEAIRRAVAEVIQLAKTEKKETDFDKLLGMGLKAPLDPGPRFTNEDDLWEKKG